MSPGGAAGCAWLLALIVVISLWPAGQLEDPSERCEDSLRLERLEREPPRDRIPFLGCPGDRASGALLRAPTGYARILMGKTIDLDAASRDELQALPGIGPGLSKRIVEDRLARGAFQDVGALRRVKGIGAARVEALRGWAHAGGGPMGPDQADNEGPR